MYPQIYSVLAFDCRLIYDGKVKRWLGPVSTYLPTSFHTIADTDASNTCTHYG